MECVDVATSPSEHIFVQTSVVVSMHIYASAHSDNDYAILGRTAQHKASRLRTSQLCVCILVYTSVYFRLSLTVKFSECDTCVVAQQLKWSSSNFARPFDNAYAQIMQHFFMFVRL